MVRFSVLASGSGGNASLLEHDGFGLLIDAGLGPRLLASRLAVLGASWPHINAVLLTHTHGDHWKDRTLAVLHQHRVPLYCHADHGRVLDHYSSSFALMRRAGLVRTYERDADVMMHAQLRCRPLEVRHDSTPTFGFRLEGNGPFAWSLGYLSDLGSWSPELADAVSGADVLALEFNHEEELERRSRRPAVLVERILSDLGHLSNEQAASCFRAIASRGEAPLHLVQLHLSRECNREALAQSAARRVASELMLPTQIHSARQDRVGPMLTLDAGSRHRMMRAARLMQPAMSQPTLPGLG